MPTTSVKTASKKLQAACEAGSETEVLKYSGALAHAFVHCQENETDEDCQEEVEACRSAVQKFVKDHSGKLGILTKGAVFGPILSAALQMALQLLTMWLQNQGPKSKAEADE